MSVIVKRQEQSAPPIVGISAGNFNTLELRPIEYCDISVLQGRVTDALDPALAFGHGYMFHILPKDARELANALNAWADEVDPQCSPCAPAVDGQEA